MLISQPTGMKFFWCKSFCIYWALWSGHGYFEDCLVDFTRFDFQAPKVSVEQSPGCCCLVGIWAANIFQKCGTVLGCWTVVLSFWVDFKGFYKGYFCAETSLCRVKKWDVTPRGSSEVIPLIHCSDIMVVFLPKCWHLVTGRWGWGLGVR